MKQQSTGFTFLWTLLARLYGQGLGEALVGDMQEEYSQRKKEHAGRASAWLASQYSRTLMSGVMRACASPTGLFRIMCLLTLIGLPLLLGSVAWLSNMDETTPQLWQMVLAGEMHKTLFVAEYWQAQGESFARIDDLYMFINVNSLLWCALIMGAIVYLDKKKGCSLTSISLFSLAAMLVPYIAGLVFIDMAQLPPKKVGPVIAFMLFNIMYLLPLTTLWLHKKANQLSSTAAPTSTYE